MGQASAQKSSKGKAKQTSRKQKRRKFSKHVIEAKKKQQQQQQQDGSDQQRQDQFPGDSINDNRNKKRSNKNKAAGKVKDPEEASSYLKLWKQHKIARSGDASAAKEEAATSGGAAAATGGGSCWKFNKNTQSWLFRHMYDAEKVSKATFALLLEYLDGMPTGTGNDATKSRIKADASRRAVRYRKYEKNMEKRQKMNSHREGGEDSAGGGDGDSRNEAEDMADESNDGGNDNEEELRWKKLSDHDKRKVYKRARKVLDTLKES